MGMAAGQARLLSITSRMSDNELRAQIINNNKMRLASESSQVSEAYIAALNEAQLMFTNYDANNNASYQALTYNALTSFNPYNNQYALINSSGNVLLSERDADFYVNSNHDLGTFLGFYGLEQTTTYWDLFGNEDVTSEVFGLTAKDELPDFTLSGADLKNIYFGTKGTTINLGKFNDSTTASGEAYFAIEDSYLTMQSSPELNEYQRLLGNYIVAKDAWTSNIRTVIEKYKLNPAIEDATGKTYLTVSALKEYMEKEDSTYTADWANYLVAIKDALVDCTKSEFSTEVNNMITSLSNSKVTEEYNSDNYKYFYDGTNYYIGELKTVQEPQKDEDGNPLTDDNGNQLYETKLAPVLYYQISKAANDDGSQRTVVKSFSGATPGEDGNPGDWNTEVTYERDPYPSGGKPAESWTYTNSVWFENEGKASTEYKLENLQILYNTKKDEFGFDVADTTKPIIPSFTVNRDMSDEEKKSTALAILDYIKNNAALYANADINAFGIVEGSSYATIAKDYNDATKALRDFLFEHDTSSTDPTTGITSTWSNYTTLDANLDDLAAIYNGDTSKLSDEFKKLIPSLLLDMVIDTYGEPQIAWIDTSAPNDSYNTNGDAKARWYENLFNRIEAGGFKVIQDGLASSPEWIEFAFESGIVTMEQVDSYNAWNSLIYSNCSDITSQTNDQMVAKAEAEYNAAMNKIENKDKRYDLELKNIDTEHNSLQTEYESIKTAIDKNVERTFKLYS